MGIDVNGSRFLLYAKQIGVDFSRTLMIGRQGLHLTPQQLAANLAEFGYTADLAEAKRLLNAEKGFTEPFLHLLEAQEIESLDASGFEGASQVHDLNLPVPDDLKNRFATVLDGGSLEHVFNFPVAVKNCMEMVAVGGHYIGISPTSNFSGHGFYQFSPELYYRVFSPENGFRVVRMLLYEDVPMSPWYEIADPIVIQSRVTFVNPTPSYLVFIAKKVEAVDVFQRCPQQSDYAAVWASGQAWTGLMTPVRPAGLLPRFFCKLPNYFATFSFLWRVAGLYRKYGYGYPRRSFKPFDPHCKAKLL